MRRRINMTVGLLLVSMLFVLMLVSLFYTPYEPNAMRIADRLSGPSASHWLGTDNFGRDLLSRSMVGTQTAFLVGAASVAIGAAGGLLVGSLAGYAGKWADELLMRATDALLAFPGILLALLLVSVFRPSLLQTILAIGILFVPSFARVVRSGVLQQREADYVRAVRAFGAGHVNVLFVQILPNIASSIITTAALSFSTAILIEAALSYLGLGVQPPDPSWGRMLNESQTYLSAAPWFTLAPGVLITISVLGFNLLSDGIRDARDVRA
ncbi:ABC transporter permease [Cohnella thailandensis]|uniref:ABC transporter permease n=1 Tax=Cohnella thailandensis TaxID=557557 RepID=A0A841T5K9_9BACL|nr:ABC transporter permease [Cohnella thailandensis]MBB6638249.1 ABC transporter permease [Cohnella thailandensis]MBP1977810.1 peptide/nickel transport system permease protein [Cohnella thailandensis]